MQDTPELILFEVFGLLPPGCYLICEGDLRVLKNDIDFMGCRAESRDGMCLDFVYIEYIFTSGTTDFCFESTALFFILCFQSIGILLENVAHGR